VSRKKAVTCPTQDQRWRPGLWAATGIPEDACCPWYLRAPTRPLSAHRLHSRKNTAGQAISSVPLRIVKPRQQIISQWVMFWPEETTKWATLRNRGCVLMTQKLRVLSACAGALQAGAALSPGKRVTLPAQEQRGGCGQAAVV